LEIKSNKSTSPSSTEERKETKIKLNRRVTLETVEESKFIKKKAEKRKHDGISNVNESQVLSHELKKKKRNTSL